MVKGGKTGKFDVNYNGVQDQLAWHAIVNSALSELSNALIRGTHTFQQLADLFLEHALGLTGSTTGCISIMPETDRDVTDKLPASLNCRFSYEGTLYELQIKRGRDGRYPALWGRALNTGKAFYTNSPANGDCQFPAEIVGLRKVPINSFLSAPLIGEGEILGHIAVADATEPYIHRDLEAVERLAALFVMTIRHFHSQKELRAYRRDLEKRVEERTAELESLNRRYRAFLDAMPDLMFQLDIRGNFLDFKGSSEELLIPEDQVVGFNLLDAPFPVPVRNYFMEKIKLTVETATTQTFEYQLQIAGNPRYYEARMAKCGPEDVVCWVRSITERKKHEERLAFTQYSVDHMGEAAFWLDSDGRFIYVNKAACNFLGYTREELLIMSVFHIDSWASEEKWTDQWQLLKTSSPEGTSYTFESYQRRKDGYEFPVEINANFVVFEGKEYNCAFVRDITERRQAENKLREERDFNKTLIDTSPTFFVTLDPQGKTLMMNTAMLDKLGYTEEEIIGTDYLETFVPEDEHTMMKEIFSHLSTTEKEIYNENHVITRDGHLLKTEWHGRPIFRSDGELAYFFGVGIDITERHKAEEARRESEERFRQMAELLPVGIYEANLDGKVLYANLSAYKSFGYLHEDLLEGINLIDIIIPKDRARAANNIPLIISGEYSGGTEYTALRKDGSTFPMISYSNAIIKRGRPIGIRGIVVDITERKKALEKEQHYQLQLMQADKMISLGTLVAGVAHEINNPNNAIMFNIPLLKEIFIDMMPTIHSSFKQTPDLEIGGLPYADVEEAVERLFDGLVRSSERIGNIVADLKNFARPGHYEMDGDVYINDVVKTSVTLLNNMIKKSTRNFTTHYGEKIPPVKGNFQRLEQVVINLIQNACQALNSKDDTIRVDTSFTPGAKGKGGTVLIQVKDEGCGIPDGNIKFITDPFYTTKRSQGGTGLGLSITTRILKDHGGNLDIRSTPGKGSRFTVNLPVTGDRKKKEKIKK